MPVPIEVADLNQRAVLWPFSHTDAYGNAVVSPSSQEISVRWVPTNRLAPDANGNMVQVDATMTSSTVIDLDSVLWLGSLEDLPGTGTLSQPTNGLHRVVRRAWALDLRGIHQRNDYSLSRLRDDIPLGESP